MAQKIIIFLLLVIISIIWGVLVYTKRSKLVKKVVLERYGAKEDIIHASVIAVPREFVINILFDEKVEIDEEIFADLTVRYNDLISGNYKIPDKFKKGKDINIIVDEVELKEPVVVSEDVIENISFDDVDFESLVDPKNVSG